MRRDFWKKNGLAVTGILCLLIAWQGRAMETVTGQESVVPEQQEARKVALTFDDGPSEYTMELSRGLKERGVQATFFLLGENMEDRREMVEQLVKDGHLIGNHSYHHVQLNKLSKEAAKGEIEKTNQLIPGVDGRRYALYSSTLRGMESGTGKCGGYDPGVLERGFSGLEITE